MFGTKPGTRGYRGKTAIDRFRAFVPDFGMDGCWLWSGRLSDKGYGGPFFVDREHGSMAAHRAAWLMFVGPIPPGLHVLHHCDTPPCVNFEECLFLGTNLDNIADRVAKGRSTLNLGEKHARAALTNQQAQAIRGRYAEGGISQKALAIEFGVTQQTISNVVRGYVYPDIW